jgi:hypothetical protein
LAVTIHVLAAAVRNTRCVAAETYNLINFERW